jgi:hypothetical protein
VRPIHDPGHFAIRSDLFLVVAAVVVGDFAVHSAGAGRLPRVFFLVRKPESSDELGVHVIGGLGRGSARGFVGLLTIALPSIVLARWSDADASAALARL